MVQMKKKSLVLSLKGLDAKTNCLAANRESLSTRKFLTLTLNCLPRRRQQGPHLFVPMFRHSIMSQY
jgi:hypothetical protein